MGDSPSIYWTVKGDQIQSSSEQMRQLREEMEKQDILAAGAQYFSRDMFNPRPVTAIQQHVENIRASFNNTDQSFSQSGMQNTSGMQSTSGIGSGSGSVPTGMSTTLSDREVSSQQIIQDRMLRENPFASNPPVMTRSLSAPAENLTDISNMGESSVMSAPFELRPKAYDDTLTTEQNTSFEDNTENNENIPPRQEAINEQQLLSQQQRLHQSDGAAQLISMRQSQSLNTSYPSTVSVQQHTDQSIGVDSSVSMSMLERLRMDPRSQVHVHVYKNIIMPFLKFFFILF